MKHDSVSLREPGLRPPSGPARRRAPRARAVLLTAAAAIGAAWLAASPAAAQTISFGKSTLAGTGLSNPTSLQFGPDGRLYVAEQNGTIFVYTIARTAPNAYQVSATESITLVRDIPNHNDDGAPNPSVTGRQTTGLLVTGTAANPVIYVTSSDPRIGGGSSGTDSNLDTNSGTLSRLTWTGSAWVKLDLVRGLPRSEENHSCNGMALDPATNTLYIGQGGNTNMGAPSNNFALLPEYALSAAILSVNLTAIGNTTYDLPTLDDPRASRNTGTPGVDLNDPFGGDNAANMAKIVPGGPVQVFAPGFRNPYDVVRTQAGRLYTIDNGPNAGWGDLPVGEGTSACTNAVHEPGVTYFDQLHYLTGPGFYGGHANPTRGNAANTFNGQSPIPAANPVECDYRVPGTQDGALATFDSSTNGLAEYTASNFGGAMRGDLLAASFGNTISRIQLSADGTTATLVQTLFSAVGNTPLDVWAQGDAGPFPGSIWVADYANNVVYVYEPNDFVSCTGAYSTSLDEDGDHYSNADEIDNGTNPCSAADVPHDWDGDFLSDLNDPDDDNDGIPDTSDRFAIDPQNGATTDLPVLLTWDNDAVRPGGFLDLGFTGLMTNGVSNYASLFDPAGTTAGGAAGVFTVDQVPAGDAQGSLNTQHFGMQLGVHVTPTTGTFTVATRVLAPFSGLVPAGSESMGVFAGTGDQDNYLKVVVTAAGGPGGVQFAKEIGGTYLPRPAAPVTLPGPDWIDLYLTFDTVAATVQPAYDVVIGMTAGPVLTLGPPEPVPASWFAGPQGLAIGILSTSAGGTPFPATWDFLKARAGGAVECQTDAACDDGNPCTDDSCAFYACRHTSNTSACDDGVACTTGDVCSNGVCAGTPTCSAGQTCDPATGTCQWINADLDNDGLVGAADPCPLQPRNQCFGPAAVDGATGQTIRINAGNVSGAACSGAKVDCNGVTWNADFGFNESANGFACNIGGGGSGCVMGGMQALFGCDSQATEDLFRCEHWDDVPAPELSYAFTVPNGTYVVNLLFANAYTGTVNPGDRTFDIQVEGQTVYTAFDQVAAAGGSAVGVVRSAVANVTDGQLNIQLLHRVENPALKAIEVLRADRDGDGFFPPADCDDFNPAIHPGASDANCNGVDENCNGTADEGYVPVATSCGVGACARTGSTACVSGTVTSTCVPGAPAAEVCDGVDNDCDGIVDDAPHPGGVALSVGAAGGAGLSWGAVSGASGYDVVRGGLLALGAGGGNFTSAINACLANDQTALGLSDPATPPAGDGYFYLVRAVNCGGGTYDGEGAGQTAPRDAAIAASPSACP